MIDNFIMRTSDVIQLVDRQYGDSVVGGTPGLDNKLRGAAMRFRAVIKRFLGERSDRLVNYEDLFELCDLADGVEIRDPEIAQVCASARSNVGSQILDTLLLESMPTKTGQTSDITNAINRQNLALNVWKLISVVKRERPETFGPKWIQMNAADVYKAIVPLIRTKDTGILNWDLVRNLLPVSLREKFVVQNVSAEQGLVNAVKEYRHIAESVGPEALAEFLVHIGTATRAEQEDVINVISEYLGPCSVTYLSLEDFRKLPEGVLYLPGPKRFIFILLRNFIYRELLKVVGDSAVAGSAFSIALEAVISSARSKLNDSSPVHLELFTELVVYWHDVLSVQSPSRMVSSVQGREGKIMAFPSLRQMVAMKEMREDRRKFVAFFMGQGKTATAFLAKEHVGARKMLYICPTHLCQQTADRVSKYYKDGEAPSVGVVKAGITPDQLEEVLRNEVVVLPYSMFKSKPGGVPLTDSIKKAGFDFVTIDEAHNAKKDGHVFAETVFDFATQMPDLYEKGWILELSGEPVPNTPDDFVTHLRIYNKEAYGDVTSLKAYLARQDSDPLELRAAVLDFLVLIDDPESWEKFMRVEPFDLYEEERRVYQAVFEDDNMDKQEKLHLLSLAILNPGLFSAAEVRSSLFDRCVQKTRECLANYDCVVIGENSYKQGFTRPHENYPDKKTFVDRLRDELGAEAEVLVIDGDVHPEERSRIIARTKNTGGKKMVLVVMTSTVREGLDLSHIHRAVLLEPTMNKPDTAQFLKRFQREGNVDVEVAVFVGADTVSEGILRHADRKAIRANRFKYGGVLTKVDVTRISEGDVADDVRFEGGRLVFGTDVNEMLLTPAQKLARIVAYLHNKPILLQRKVIEMYGDEFAKLYMTNWESSYSGNNARLVAALIEKLEEDGVVHGGNYGDIASGPLILENTLGRVSKRGTGVARKIRSVDLNPYLLERGKQFLKSTDPSSQDPVVSVSSMTDMSSVLRDGSLDLANCSLALHCTHLNVIRKNPADNDRVKALCEINRVLKDGGVAVITLPHEACLPEEVELFKKELINFGFEVLPGYSGVGQSVDSDGGSKDRDFKNHTIVCKKVGKPCLDKLSLRNLKFSRVSSGGASVRKPRPMQSSDAAKGSIHTEFKISGCNVEYVDGIHDRKAAEAVYRAKMSQARIYIQELYAKHGSSLNGLSEDEAASLDSRGISIIMLHFSGVGQWIFSLNERPDYTEFVFPAA